jgi:ABC-type Mn2+/Zn2+ transport system ATPase subunit
MSSLIEAEPERAAPLPACLHFIKTIEFEDWPPLGHTVALSLSPRRTVLLGQNGGGKSLLLEGFRDAANCATGFVLKTPQPIRKFTLAIAPLSDPKHTEFRYR